ncbi:MAG: ABC transporter permease [Armatimonadota bacterium]|nr:ABC transporter permease [Armatimonadota bacterium]
MGEHPLRSGATPSPAGLLWRPALHALTETGRAVLMLASALRHLGRGRVELGQTIVQINRIGVESIFIVLITGLFSGVAVAFQSARQLAQFGGQGFVGGLVGLSMAREAAPVFTAITVAGRVGAGIAAEIGAMAVTEQIDALRVLATDPVRYLVVPRLLAAAVALPGLTLLANIVGSAGGYLIATSVGISGSTYLDSLRRFLWAYDIYAGLIKALFFGLIIAGVGCFRGLHATGGADGVGRATTGAVVAAIVLILIFNTLLDFVFF